MSTAPASTANRRRVSGCGVQLLAISADGKTLYTANGRSNDVSVIDLDRQQVTFKIGVGRGPWGIAVVARP